MVVVVMVVDNVVMKLEFVIILVVREIEVDMSFIEFMRV